MEDLPKVPEEEVTECSPGGPPDVAEEEGLTPVESVVASGEEKVLKGERSP